MKLKKIIGILICMLFLFSSLPVVNSADSNKNGENHLLKSDDCIQLVKFIIEYGRIINHGLEVTGFPFGWCYNITPINLRYTNFIWKYKSGFYTEKGILDEDTYYIPKDFFPSHGFISKNYIFIWVFYII